MAFASSLVMPTEMTITTCISLSIVILTFTASVILATWLFCQLTPTRRRDVILLVKAITRARSQ